MSLQLCMFRVEFVAHQTRAVVATSPQLHHALENSNFMATPLTNS